MAEGGERTEQATPQKLRKARERGEVAVSRDLTSALMLAVGAGVLVNQFTKIGAKFQQMAKTVIQPAAVETLTPAKAITLFAQTCFDGVLAVAPILVGLWAMAVLGPFLQVGPLLAMETLKPKLSKLNPLAGLKRIFMSLPPYVELIKAVIKIMVVGVLCWQVIQANLREIVLVGRQPLHGAALLAGTIIGQCLQRGILFFVGLAVLDFAYQRWQFSKNQRMTKEEVKREYKEQEGDPHHKHARKHLHQEILEGQMLENVRKADVVVTNPDHYACALRYDPDEEGAPRLIGKGKNHLAEKIKEIARQQDIPIVQNVGLARALYQLEVDDLIPEELYETVAEILRWVEEVARSKGEIPAWVKKPEEGGKAGT